MVLNHISFTHETSRGMFAFAPQYLDIWHNHQQSIKYPGRLDISWKYTLSKDESLLLFRLGCVTERYYKYFRYNVKDHKLEVVSKDRYEKAVDELVLEDLLEKHLSFPKTRTTKKNPPLLPLPPLKAKRDVSLVRSRTESCDFLIVCQNEVSIPVHSLILTTYWPYFESMMENDCLEKRDKVLTLDYPDSWVQKLVSYLYGEELELNFDEKTGLMVLGELYQLPDLVELMTGEILAVPDTTVSLSEVVSGWKRANEASNEKIRRRLAKTIVLKRSEFPNDLSDLCELCTVQEAFALLTDTLALTSVTQ